MPKVSEDHWRLAAVRSSDGARRCFAEYGYDKVAVRRLNRHRMPRCPFHHFRDKDAFFALAREDTERMACSILAKASLV